MSLKKAENQVEEEVRFGCHTGSEPEHHTTRYKEAAEKRGEDVLFRANSVWRQMMDENEAEQQEFLWQSQHLLWLLSCIPF